MIFWVSDGKPQVFICCILQNESDHSVSDANPHISNIGRMIEDMENRIRSSLNDIYFGKTRDVVNDLR